MKRENSTKIFDLFIKNTAHKAYHKIALLMCLVLSLTCLFTGCGNTTTDNASNTVIMTIQETDVTMTDAYLFLIQYLINNHSDPATFADEATKQAVLNQVIDELQLETVEYLITQSSGTVVSGNGIENAAATADSYYAFCGGEDFFSSYGIDYADVCKLFEKQAYINQLQTDSISDLSTEYHTQLEEQYKDAKIDKIYYASFPMVQYDDEGNPVLNDYNEYQLLSEDEIATASANASAFLARAQAGESMEDLVSEYGIELNSASDYYYEGTGEHVFDEAVSDLEDSEFSDVINTSVGYTIVRMDKHDDVDYKNYIINFAAKQQASNSFPNMQEYWKSAAGLSNVEVNTTAVYAIDVQKLASDMVNRGVYTLN